MSLIVISPFIIAAALIWYVFSPKGFGGHGTAVWAVVSWPTVILLVVFVKPYGLGPWFCVWPAAVSVLLGIFHIMIGGAERSIWTVFEGLFAVLSGGALFFWGSIAYVFAHL